MMKTPRELLLARHESAQHKLDALRKAALARLEEDASPILTPANPSPGPLAQLLVLMRSLRWHLAGMAAVWAIVVLLNADRLSSKPAPSGSAPQAASSRQLLVALLENRRLLLELMEPSTPEPPSLPTPHPLLPSHRSALQTSTALA